MWFKVKSFLLFILKSTNQHGVHSPFVYNLVTKCFYQKTNPTKINSINNVKKWIYASNKIITITNFGSDTKVFNKYNSKIASASKIACISNRKYAILIRILNYFEPNNILEIGTSIGLETASLSIGNLKAKINTLEDCEDTAVNTQKLFDTFKLKNIQITVGEINEILPSILTNNQYNLIYFNGNHQKETTLHYFNLCLKSVHNDSIFIFDGINLSSEMQEGWLTIKKHPKVTISIDTFFLGLIFFRKEQQKEHFTIRV